MAHQMVIALLRAKRKKHWSSGEIGTTNKQAADIEASPQKGFVSEDSSGSPEPFAAALHRRRRRQKFSGGGYCR